MLLEVAVDVAVVGTFFFEKEFRFILGKDENFRTHTKS